MEEVKVRVLTDAIKELTLGDLETLEDAVSGRVSIREMRQLLDQLVSIEGLESTRDLKLKHLRQVGQAVMEIVTQAANPTEAEGNSS